MTYTRVSGSPVLTYSAVSSASRSKSATLSSSRVKMRIRPYGRAAAAAGEPAADPVGPGTPAAPAGRPGEGRPGEGRPRGARPDSVTPASAPGTWADGRGGGPGRPAR